MSHRANVDGVCLGVSGIASFRRTTVTAALHRKHIVQGERQLLLPHADVPSIASIDWPRLAARGYKGVVFDKDNTLTLPYTLSLHPSVATSLGECKAAFEGRVVLFSNSAGAPRCLTTEDFDQRQGLL